MPQDQYEIGSLEDADKFAVMRMALKADIDAEAEGLTQALQRFDALVRADERERCAYLRKEVPLCGVQSQDYEQGFWNALDLYEGLIRSMK